MHRLLTALVVAVGLFSWTVGPALAFDCVVANKPEGAGAAFKVDLTAVDPNTGGPVIEATKPNPGQISGPGGDNQVHGAFVTVTFPGDMTVDTFVHGPTKANAPFAEPGVNPGAIKQEQKGGGCDGKGLDTIDACFAAAGG